MCVHTIGTHNTFLMCVGGLGFDICHLKLMHPATRGDVWIYREILTNHPLLSYGRAALQRLDDEPAVDAGEIANATTVNACAAQNNAIVSIMIHF